MADFHHSPATTVVLATHNKGKAIELTELLRPFQLTVIGLDAFPEIGDVEETGTTFAQNALLKATTISEATGLVAIADDSGLAVDALGGAPGVYSARYGLKEGEVPPERDILDARNLDKLLQSLENVPDNERTAHFCCTMAAATPAGKTLVAEGKWFGTLQRMRQGVNGFGYDPIFYVAEAGMTSAQLSPAEKNARSHRYKAVQALLQKWPPFWQEWLTNCK